MSTEAAAQTTPLLEARGIKKHFLVRGGLLERHPAPIKALDGIKFTLQRGETLGIVGESGCGKTTLGRCIARLEEPSEGEILFNGRNLVGRGATRREDRRNIQIVFQDPYSSLNPRKTVGSILTEPFRVHGLLRADERVAAARELLATVGLKSEHIDRFPHEFSGGERQRISIARALALRPQLIVADEPVSALDVSIQAQVVNLFVSLQRSHRLTYIFISHDLRVVRHICDRVGVMYLGRIVELGDTDALYRQPLHPYTDALLAAVPRFDRKGGRRAVLRGEIPSARRQPKGCAFHPRCPRAQPRCGVETPALGELATGRSVACHYPLSSHQGSETMHAAT
jgi:oligopeptide transport system ATP-binding protein